MSKLAWIVALATIIAATSAIAETTIPDLRGTWKGNSESIILGAGNSHHEDSATAEPRSTSVAFTMTIKIGEGARPWPVVGPSPF